MLIYSGGFSSVVGVDCGSVCSGTGSIGSCIGPTVSVRAGGSPTNSRIHSSSFVIPPAFEITVSTRIASIRILFTGASCNLNRIWAQLAAVSSKQWQFPHHSGQASCRLGELHLRLVLEPYQSLPCHLPACHNRELISFDQRRDIAE